MDMYDLVLNEISLETIGFFELAVRVFMAAALGFVLGYERDKKDKPIDFRAFMVVCIATCVIAIMGQELYSIYDDSDTLRPIDLAKIISGVMTGIGFLGAGAIIHSGDTKIIGTATGASIWASGAIGLSIGFGLYGLAIVAFLAVAAILTLGGVWMEKAIGRPDNGDV